MQDTMLHEDNGLRTFAVILEQGEEVVTSLSAFAAERRLRASHFSAIGAFSDVVVAYFDWATRRYRDVSIPEQVEVVSLLGDVTEEGNERKIHAHIAVARSDATMRGGHLIAGNVRPTLEVVLSETPRHLCRRFDPRAGLALIDPSR